MQDLDVNMIRETEAEMSGFELPNDIMTFYYDETGNCRKFCLNENGINSVDALKHDYILGGICFDGVDCPADIEKLFNNLNFQQNLKELKFKQLVKKSKNFFDCLNEERLTCFLEWLNTSGLYLHYSTVNNFYYSIVDIVDCLWETQPQFDFGPEWNFQLKSALYQFACKYQDEFIDLFIRYEYPNIISIEISSFCREIVGMIEENGGDNFMLECFRQMLKVNAKQEKMCFLQDNITGLLIDEYYMFRVSRCCMFKNSFHYFDEESIDEAKMKEINLIDGNMKLKNYRFINSTKDKLIQVSDAVVGILAKLFEYVDETQETEFIDRMKNATDRQLSNLKIINNLVDKAEEKKKEKQYSTHKREYIGKIVDGEFVPNKRYELEMALAEEKKRGPKSSKVSSRKFYGATYLFDQMGEQLGITAAVA